MRFRNILRVAAGTGLAGVLLAGCAYYNTYYLAKRYYARTIRDLPYAVDKTDLTESPLLTRAIDLSKKLIERYPKSKWVDDAYILWSKSLIASDDPRQAVKMLEEFDLKYPASPVASEARFYLGIGYLRSRKYERAVAEFDTFLTAGRPKSLVPFARLERARALLALERPGEAAVDAGVVLDKFPKSPIARRARETHAQALLAQKSFDAAREDYRVLGRQAGTDEDRLGYLLREAECLEAAQKYDEALALLRDAMAHLSEPAPPDTSHGRVAVGPTGPGADHYGRLLTRIGTVHLRAGRQKEAIDAYRRVVTFYPRTPLAGEAQFRMGYAYETAADDFDKAREEYARVRDHSPGTSFAEQATSRVASLDRLAQYRSASDSLARRSEAGFLLAEQYLFDLDKPDRALEEYRRIEKEFTGTPLAGKAINGQGWVLSRKLKEKTRADSLFWRVVREYPGTEAQLAARDYLAFGGIEVPSDLIKLPEPPPPDTTAADTGIVLTHPPEGSIPLGTIPGSPGDSQRLGPRPQRYTLPPVLVPGPRPVDMPKLETPFDPDSAVRGVPALPLPPGGPVLPDTTRRSTPRDSLQAPR